MTRIWCSRLAVLVLAAFTAAPGRAAEESLPSDLALVPRDESAFISISVRDLMAGELSKDLVRALGTEPGTLPYFLRTVGVPPADVERLTFLPLGDITIVRTARPYDRDKLLKGFKVKGKQQYRGKTIHVGTRAVYLVDERVYVTAPPYGVLQEALLDRVARDKGGPLQAPLAVAAGKHHVVLGLNPVVLLLMMSPRPIPAKPAGSGTGEKSPSPKEARPPRKDAPPPPPAAARAAAEVQGESEYVRAAFRDLPPFVLPYKPLLQARYVVVAADVGEESRLAARLVYADKGLTRDAETAVKTTLYVARQVLAQFFKGIGLAGIGKARLELPRHLRAALRDAVVRTDGSAVTVAARVKIDAAEAARLTAAVRRRAVRQQSANNLRLIGVAMHHFLSDTSDFPPAAVYGANGKPLLSWRVAILPYIEEGKLYKEFKLDEPWDSPHNKKLLAKMPKAFAPVLGRTKEPHSTYYQVFVGPQAPFRLVFDDKALFKSRGPRITTFLDGFSQTFLVVEAGTAVPWTKPEDIPFDPKKPLPKLGGLFSDGFHAAFADGAVRFLRKDIDKKTFQWLIMPADGEVIDWDKVDPAEARSRGRAPGAPPPRPKKLPPKGKAEGGHRPPSHK